MKKLLFNDKMLAISCVLLMVGAGYILYRISSAQGARPPAYVAPSGTDAQIVCEKFVKTRLKSPTSAEFPGSVGTKIDYVGANGFRITSYVDADNSFSAHIRIPYICEVKHTGGGQYNLIDLQLVE